MDHEVFVPFPAETVRRALTDPERVSRSVPGLQREAGAEGITGRLRFRIGGSTITYRGVLRVTENAGTFAAEGEGMEARGGGSVKLAIEIGLEQAAGGTLLTFSGTVQADGRLSEFEPAVVTAAGYRLLDRFVTGLTRDLPELDAVQAPDLDLDLDLDLDPEPEPEDNEAALPEGLTVPESVAELEAFDDAPEPPAEAAHARRTMIGRSAEEVDHAPPRGRYAPVPPPEAASATATLRWAAPAAAVLIAGAVVVGRALRRRRL
jgi:carbon monoxide dehydrogenase subunit G